MESETTAAFIGAVIGGGLTIVGNLVHESWRDARRAEQLSHAIAGEVNALIEIIEQRGYLEAIKEYAQLAHQGDAQVFKVRVTNSFFPVTEASLENIGLLPAELPILIPRFLTLAKSALEDIQALEAGHWADRDAEDFAEGYDELSEILEGAVAAGRSIVVVVASIYGSPHGRYPFGLHLRRVWWRIKSRLRPQAESTTAPNAGPGGV